MQSQNIDGGWGYRVGGASFVEPTAAVMLALNEPNPRARDFLIANQHADGGWGIASVDDESGWMTAWAVWALSRANESASAARGIEWLARVPVLSFSDPNIRTQTLKTLQIDASLRGFPWQPGDASWVHPTALGIIALVAAGQRHHPRAIEAVRYLYDRAIASGGWNVGNPWMIGKPLAATMQDTAIALIALRAMNESASEPHIARAFDFLRDAVMRVNTPSELAWVAWAMSNWKFRADDLTARLNSMQSADGSWVGNPFITAIAILASES